MTDNSAALRRVRRHDSLTKHRRATEALRALEQAGEPVSFPAVARRAGVSVSLLYSHPDLAAQIATARDRQRQAGQQRTWRLPARSLITEQSLRAELANAKEQVRQLTADLALLRQRLAHQLGADADLARGRDHAPMLGQLERRAAEVEADNHRLHRQITQLNAELRELSDTLDAARATNRDLMNELNRAAGPRTIRSSGRVTHVQHTPPTR